MSYTKGPWKYDRQLADTGDKETAMYGRSKELHEPVCIIPHDDITEKGYEEVQANARLIAASPDLLQVCKDFVLLADLHDWEGAAIDHARKVIKQATGAV